MKDHHQHDGEREYKIKWHCSVPGCPNLRISIHNSKCRYHMNEYMRLRKAKAKYGDDLVGYIPRHKGGDK